MNTTSKRTRKVINYADKAESTDISDDDEFSGFSPSRSNTTTILRSPSVATGSKLRKKSSMLITDSSDGGTATATDGDDDGDDCFKNALPISKSVGGSSKRTSRHDKIFQRDLETALALSRDENGDCVESNLIRDSSICISNKETKLIATDSPAAVAMPGNIYLVQSDSTASSNNKDSDNSLISTNPITTLTKMEVPVEVHGIENNLPHRCSINIDYKKNKTPILKERLSNDLVSEKIEVVNVEISSANKRTSVNNLNKSSPLLINSSDNEETTTAPKLTRPGKRKLCVIESDDDDFNTVSPSVATERIQDPDLKREDASNIESTIEDHIACAPKSDETATRGSKFTEGHVLSSAPLDRIEKEHQTGQKKTVKPTPKSDMKSYGKRSRKIVSLKESDTEDEWGGGDDSELDEDDLSGDDGDFEPSPQKEKRKPQGKKTNLKTRSNSKENKFTSKVDDIKSKVKLKKKLVHNEINATDIKLVIRNGTCTSLHSNTTSFKDSNSFLSNNSKPESDCATKAKSIPIKSPSSNVITKSPKVVTTSQSVQRPGLARAAFKSPLISSGSIGILKKSSANPSTLRIGLSRRTNFKPLHPNASLK